MRMSNAFIPTLRALSQEADSVSHILMLRAGLIRMLTAGVYVYLPCGWRVLKKIEDIIRDELDRVGAQELLLSALQPIDLWKMTGRDKELGQTLISFKDRKGRRLCLGPTHEEVITDLVKNNLSSYRQMPLMLYQIQTKFRDELRPRAGLMRSCEFIMKDAYSFDADEQSLDRNYEIICETYKRIFSRCGLDSIMIEADPGIIGGNLSHEFMVLSESGEDKILACPKCEKAFAYKEENDLTCPKCSQALNVKGAIEIGHTFKLGTKYSKVQNATFQDDEGKRRPILMGCYGIGVSRLLPAIIDQHHDEKGIIWPKDVSPYEVAIIVIETKPKAAELANKIHSYIESLGKSVLLDERDISAGVKFNDLDLIGIPLRIIIGKDWFKNKTIEISYRDDKAKTIKLEETQLLTKLKQLLK
ncbi:MAG: proline--tRNA ligase [Candidatus Omnitrophica bacterium]|nr:proline--tRNA ligase [Candidatus Omnitrophota bacterium]